MRGKSYWGELGANWHTLLASATGLALGAAINHYASNLFGPALLKEFGWQKSELALVGTLSLINLIFLPLIGRFTDRYGARVAAIIGFIAVAFSYFAYSRMNGELWQYFAITGLHMVFGVMTTTIVFGRVIVERFDAARGIALSILMTGAPLAAAIFVPILGKIIAKDGWRSGYEMMMWVTLVAGAIAITFIGPKKDADLVVTERPRLTLAEFKQVARHPAFLLLVGGMFLCNIPQILVGGQLNILLEENGSPAALAAWIVSLFASGVIVGRFLSGLALDKFPAEYVALFALGLPAIGYFALATPFDPVWLLAGSVLIVGLAQGAEGDLGAYLASRKFGVKHFSFVYSFLIVAIGLANALGSAILSVTLANTGRFDAFLIVCAIATLSGALAFVFAGKSKFAAASMQEA